MTTTTTAPRRRRAFDVGRDRDGLRIVARVELRTITEETVRETTTHERAPVPFDEVSVTYEAWKPGHREGLPGARGDIESGGASRDPFREVRRPVDGWTREALATLADMGDRWHLNALRAGCDHIEAAYEDGPYGRQPVVGKDAPTCPETGYRWGSAWLVEPLTDDARAYFLHIIEHGTPPEEIDR